MDHTVTKDVKNKWTVLVDKMVVSKLHVHEDVLLSETKPENFVETNGYWKSVEQQPNKKCQIHRQSSILFSRLSFYKVR